VSYKELKQAWSLFISAIGFTLLSTKLPDIELENLIFKIEDNNLKNKINKKPLSTLCIFRQHNNVCIELNANPNLIKAYKHIHLPTSRIVCTVKDIGNRSIKQPPYMMSSNPNPHGLIASNRKGKGYIRGG
jgi:hypothetical protein